MLFIIWFSSKYIKWPPFPTDIYNNSFDQLIALDGCDSGGRRRWVVISTLSHPTSSSGPAVISCHEILLFHSFIHKPVRCGAFNVPCHWGRYFKTDHIYLRTCIYFDCSSEYKWGGVLGCPKFPLPHNVIQYSSMWKKYLSNSNMYD